MDHRLKLLFVVVLTVIITLAGTFVTEYVRQSMTFSWGVDVGDEFLYEVSVTGNTTTTTQILPPIFAPMNNTRIVVEIVSLPNLTLYYSDIPFIQDVINHVKTIVRFENGSDIPTEFYYAINNHASNSILPIGAWGYLGSLFPNQINQAISNQEMYISVTKPDSFYFGYWLNETTSTSEWHGILNLNTGVPIDFSFSILRIGQPWVYSYNVTMTLVD
ncbi:MAG: hypothetical protein ACFFE6_15230 [Candidatus Thorarchaeota archaeon]